jgi:DeoR/GlpR family transcriptional regulator of sugar metabolism
MDVTTWLLWFLESLQRAVEQAQQTLDAVLLKARYWQRWATLSLNERQVKVLNRLLDGFEGKLTNSKWAAIAKCSPDTALRDINDLLARGVLSKTGLGDEAPVTRLREVNQQSSERTCRHDNHVHSPAPSQRRKASIYTNVKHMAKLDHQVITMNL